MAEIKEEGGVTQENVSDEDKIKSCDSCSFRGVGNPANSYCPACTEYLCMSCVEIHGSLKAMRAHDILQIAESAEAAVRRKGTVKYVMICDIHRSENVAEFCVTHENAICRICKRNKHRKCDTKNLREAAEERQNDVKDFIEDIKSLTSEFEEIKNFRQLAKSQLFEKTARIRADLKKITEENITWVEKLEKETVEEIYKTEKKMISKIDSHIAVAEDIINHLVRIKADFEDIGSDNSVAAFVLREKTEQQIWERWELKHKIEKEINSLTSTFRKSDKLTRLMSEISSIGIIEIEETRPVDFTEISGVTKKHDFAVESNMVTGCTFMPNGHLVICEDMNNTVKVFTTDFQLENELKCDSRVSDVVALSAEEILVTKPKLECLEVLNVSKTVMKVKSIQVGEHCWGVDIKKDKIYVTCHFQRGKGGI